MAKVVKSGKKWKVIHETNKTTLSTHISKKRAQKEARAVRKRSM